MNHAHSDYIELVLEGGLLSLALMALFFFVLVRSMLPLTRRSPALNDVGAVVGLQVILLILLHSLADYPLRMPAIAVIFAVCMALLLRRPVVAEADD